MRMLFLPVVRHISSSCAVTHPAFLSQTSNGHMVHFLEPVSFDPSTAMENGLHCMEVIRAALKCADSVPFTIHVVLVRANACPGAILLSGKISWNKGLK